MKRKITRFFIGTILWSAALVIAAFNALLVWVEAGPRSMEQAIPYLESSFNTPGAPYNIKIGKSWLIWSGWEQPLSLQLDQVQVLTHSGEVFSTFPQIVLGVDILSLFSGQVLPRSLTLEAPIISLFQHSDRTVTFGFAPPEAVKNSETLPVALLLAPFLNEDSTSVLRKLRAVKIDNAEVSVGNDVAGVIFEAKNASILFEREPDGKVIASLQSSLHYDDYQSQLMAQFDWQRGDKAVFGRVRVDKLMPSVLAELFLLPDTSIPSINLPLSGVFDLALAIDGTVESLAFNMQGGEGQINHPQLAEPLTITALTAKGSFLSGFKQIQLDALNIQLGESNIKADAFVNLTGDVSITGTALAQQVPVSDLKRYWVPSLAPETRAWVLENITEGRVSEASANFNIKPGDLALPVLPKEAVDAHILLEGARIRYLPEHPAATEVTASIHIDGKAMQAKISSARYLKNTTLSDGVLEIADLNVDNPHINMSFAAKVHAKDAGEFLGFPPLGHALKLNFTPNNVEGYAALKASLAFNFYAPRDEKGQLIGDGGVTYDVELDLKEISVTQFMQRFDIEKAIGTMKINNSGMEYKGDAVVNGARFSDASVKHIFASHEPYDTFISGKLTASPESLVRFGMPLRKELSGQILMDTEIKLGKGREWAKIVADLTPTAINAYDKIGWSKPIGEAVTLSFISEMKNTQRHLTSLSLKGDAISAQGSLMFDENSNIQQLSLTPLKLGNTQLTTFTMEPIVGGNRIYARGNSADIRFLTEPDPAAPKTFSLAKFPALKLDVEIDRLILGEKREVAKVIGAVDCDLNLCMSADIKGNTADKPFSFRILRNPKGQRQLAVNADDAGEFLRILDIHEGMKGGILSLTGNYDDSKLSSSGSILTGRLTITEHTVNDAPILMKIVSLASPTGFLDSLQGKGIRFDKLRAPFTLHNDVFTFTKTRWRGSALGLTAQGTITLPQRDLALEGTVAPANVINSIVGKVPLVGDVLTGKDGGGVFAANYSLKGPSDNPDVSVNPLSMLAPGFLRDIFNNTEGEEEKN